MSGAAPEYVTLDELAVAGQGGDFELRIGEFPPNFAEIVPVLGDSSERAVYAYDHVIYAPSVTDEDVEAGFAERLVEFGIIAHELTHFRQHDAHDGGCDGWWQQYLEDPQFRLEQEVEAMRVQLAAIEDRPRRREVKRFLILSLRSPIYGRPVTKDEARRLLA